MGNMGNVGGKRTRRVDSLTNRGCIFGSMSGLVSRVGTNPNLNSVYRQDTSYCQWKCIPFGCKDGFEYMKKNGMIACNKGVGGIGRMQSSPGIGILFGGGCQKGWSY